MKTLLLVALVALVGCAGNTAPPPESLGSNNWTPPGAPPADPDAWPRQFPEPGATLVMYQPQVESWVGNQLAFRAAIAAKPNLANTETYGVVWGSARTEVNRELRQVTLQDIQLTRASFPTLPDNGASYLAALRQQIPEGAKIVALDRIETSLAASQANLPTGVAVKNTVPKIIVSTTPAVLIPIEGKPAIRAVAGQSAERVLNTRALIVRPTGTKTWYLHLYDGWLSAPALGGPWTLAANPPSALPVIAQTLGQSGEVDLIDGGNAQPKPSLANGVPTVYVSQVPTELVVLKGQPEFVPIGNTTLMWCTNTAADMIFDNVAAQYYVLLSGRWFRAGALQGPWRYVASNALPPSFALIPAASPAGVVLASVSGTTQAREAVIANSVPHTATVPLTDPPTFTATYDGAPQFAPIVGTPLQYALNSPEPVIEIDPATFYSLRAGVWFTATSASGPWFVAKSVPEVIYTIPPSSPLHYVTYSHVYGSTPTEVYVGYTPGYLGTVVAPDGVVVYGTGYEYSPWVGSAYYAPPPTWGVAAVPVYNPYVGWGYGYGMGLTTAAMVDSWNSPYYYSSAYHGYPCCGSTSASVYGQYGNVKTSGTDTWYSNSNGQYGEKATGSYTNEATGTKGSYDANRSYDYDTDTAKRDYNRSFTTQGGTTGDVTRTQTYNTETGKETYSSSADATGQRGNTVDKDVSASSSPGDKPTFSSQTSVTSAKTGNTYDVPNDKFAGSDGNVYQNSSNGWQKASSNGWQSAGGDNSWADREQQARSQGSSNFSSFQNHGFSGGGFGGGGGWGNHFGGGGGFGGRFGGGSFGGFHGGGRR